MIAKALRLIRQYHNMSRLDAASALNISKEALIKIESGQIAVTKSIIDSYSQTFDIPSSSLIFFSESLSITKGKRAKKLRVLLAGKALNILEWLAEKNGSTTKTKAQL